MQYSDTELMTNQPGPEYFGLAARDLIYNQPRFINLSRFVPGKEMYTANALRTGYGDVYGGSDIDKILRQIRDGMRPETLIQNYKKDRCSPGTLASIVAAAIGDNC